MPASLDSAVRRAVDAAIEVAWAQWAALGPVAASRREARAIVDPEALILLSSVLSDEEPRLGRLLAWWAGTGSRLLSAQRCKNLGRTFPKSASRALAGFARGAVAAGDLRWRALGNGRPKLAAREKDLAATPSVRSPAALLVRLRLGLGVGIKADVLGHLLGLRGASVTIPAIAQATCYYPRAVRRAVEDLVAAGFALARATSPASYGADSAPWRQVLGIRGEPPAWLPWHAVFAFIVDLREWKARLGDQSEYVISSKARDLVNRHQARLAPLVLLPDPWAEVGEAYLPPFIESLGKIAQWMEAAV